VIVPFTFSEIVTSVSANSDKLSRQYDWLDTLIRVGAVQFSTDDTPIMRSVRRYLDRYPNIEKTDPLADLGDALVALTYACPEIWTQVKSNFAFRPPLLRLQQRRKNPYDILRENNFRGA